MQGIKVDIGTLLDISTSSVFKYKDYMSSFKSRLEQQEKTNQTKLLLFLLRILSMLPLGHQSGVPGESHHRCPWNIHHSSRLCVSFRESSTDLQGTTQDIRTYSMYSFLFKFTRWQTIGISHFFFFAVSPGPSTCEESALPQSYIPSPSKDLLIYSLQPLHGNNSKLLRKLQD